MSSSHIILDFKNIRELGMVQSSINRGVIKQKIGLGGGEVMKQIFHSGLINFVRDSGVSAILVGGEYELPLVLFLLLLITMKE